MNDIFKSFKSSMLLGGNGDPSVIYQVENKNGDEKTSLKINGEEIDLTDAKSVERAKDYLRGMKNNFGTTFLKALGIDTDKMIDDHCDKLDELRTLALEDKQKEAEADLDDDFDWSSVGVDWDKDSHCIADLYLSENFPGYDEQPEEDQARQIKTIAAFYEWLKNKE